jgi:hypothetical protein
VTDLSRTLDAVVAFIRSYVACTSAQAWALALWIAHTHALDAFETTPYAAVTSAVKRCGKSRLFDTIELLVARPWRVVSPSEAVMFRKIAADRPTLLLDETDAIFNDRNGNTEPLRALLNAGNRIGTTVPRCVGPTQQLVSFDVFCPKALAGIGSLPDTIADRAIVIRLARKAPGEAVERFRRREALERAEPLFIALGSWAQDAIPLLQEVRPELPAELDDRAEEAWEPLFQIAALAGGDWPDRIRRAALALSAGDDVDEDELAVRLLADCKAAFEKAGAEKVSTAELIDRLAADEDAPWGDWRGDKVKPRTLSRLLRPFGIRPRTVRFDDDATAKGYQRTAFEDAWKRYLPTLPVSRGPVSVTPVTTAQPSQKRPDCYPSQRSM